MQVYFCFVSVTGFDAQRTWRTYSKQLLIQLPAPPRPLQPGYPTIRDPRKSLLSADNQGSTSARVSSDGFKSLMLS